MPIETMSPSIEKEKKDKGEEKGLVEHLINLRMVVGRMLSGDIETGSGVSSTVGSRRFDPQNQTIRGAVVSDTSSSGSDDSSNTTPVSDDK
jgi:hypothetical protein